MIAICQEYFKVEKWTIWAICAFDKKWSFFYKTIYGQSRIVPEWNLSNVLKKKQRKNKIAFERKLLRILERLMWFKLYFTHLIWIYLKFCQNRRYKWKHTYFYKSWSFFSKWTVWIKPYCLGLNFFQILLDILENATQSEPHVFLIKLVEFL